MRLRPFIRSLAAVFFLASGSGTGMLCWGQHPDYRDSTHWDIEFPVWVPGFRGAVSFGDITIDTDRDFGGGGGFFDQIFDSKLGLDYYLVGKIRYSHNRWSVQADVFGGRIEHSTIFNYNGADLANTKISLLIPRFTVYYQVFESAFKENAKGMLRAYVYSGLKVFNAGVQATLPDPITPIDLTTNWTEFLVGGSISYDLSNFTFTFRSDTAPFKLFSKASWWYQCYASYRFGKRISAQLGWVRQDFSSLHKVEDQDLRMNFTLQGPMAGVAIHF